MSGNPEDDETERPGRRRMVKWDPTEPSNWRATGDLADWLERRHGRIGIGGIDTRRLTRAIRQQGAPHVALAHDPAGPVSTSQALVAAARGFAGLEGRDLARDVTCAQTYRWDAMRWAWPGGYGRPDRARHQVVAIDYGAKRNILRSLAALGCGHRVARHRDRRRGSGASPRRRFPVERAGRPGGHRAYAVPMIRHPRLRPTCRSSASALATRCWRLALGARR
jgi:carbamoyl-phosphate synthase small subunit